MKPVGKVTVTYERSAYEKWIVVAIVTMGDREWLVEYDVENGFPTRPYCRCREDDYEIWDSDHQPYCPLHYLYAD